jgi:AP-2 complex subunit alpha
LQVRILRLLRLFPIPATESLRLKLNEMLNFILSKTEVTKNVNKNNAEHCILFEAVELIIAQGEASDPTLRVKMIGHLSKFINIKEPNIRYLGLETMSRLTHLEGCADAIRKQQSTIFVSLKDADISIRRRALDLVFAMCDHSIAESVVKELLTYLAIADYAIKDEMVLKVAILAERFSPSKQWYVDTIIQLIGIAGDSVSDDIWHRVVQIVTNSEDLQKYAASKMYHALEPLSAHETAVKIGGYILGEFGFLLNEGDLDNGAPVSGLEQFAVLHQHFPKVSTNTKCLMLSTYVKIQNLYPELRSQVLPVFEAYTSAMDAELQQRSVEYFHLPDLREDVTSTVLDAMPPFPERDSILEARLKAANKESNDKDQWGESTEEVKEQENDDDRVESRSRGMTGGSIKAPSAAPSAADDGDLLGLGSLDLGGSSAPAPVEEVDPLSVPVTNRIGISPENAERVQKWLLALQIKPSGILYEDEYVQIGVKKSITGASGSFSLFFGNKMAVPIVGLKVRVPEFPALKVELGDFSASVSVGAQGAVPFSIECMAPFVDSAPLQVSFISNPGTGHAYALRVPVGASTFCEPVELPGPDFKTRWTALAGAPKEATAVITPKNGDVSLESAKTVLGRIGMSNVEAGAPGATGASSFRTRATAPTGQFISVGCLAMIIPDMASGVYKVALRTQHPDVSKALLTTLQGFFAA